MGIGKKIDIIDVMLAVHKGELKIVTQNGYYLMEDIKSGERVRLNESDMKTIALKRYNIYYRKYNIFANDYIPYVKEVYTDDIYHEIGKMICKSIEKIESIGYTEPRVSNEECEKYWADNGYRKLSHNIWVADGERRT